MLINLNKQKTKIKISENIDKIIIVCSHERSGTHFLMNSISKNSNYTSDPFLNFDLIPLGDSINFYSKKNIKSFLKGLLNLKINNKHYMLSSIIKSHHPSYYFENLYNDNRFIFLYIHRNPIETLISFWRLVQNFDWHEGPYATTPLQFIKSKPEGQMMRYQKQTYTTIFERWANHVLEWLEASKKNKNIILINFSDLNLNYNNTLKFILKKINILEIPKLEMPSKEYVKGKDIDISKKNFQLFEEYINQNINKYPALKKLYSWTK